MDAIIYKFILSLLLGAFIGIERQMHATEERSAKNYLGLRTFALVTVLGTVNGFLVHSLPLFSLLLTSGTILLIIVYYIFDCINTKDYGITTEVTLIFSYLIGNLIAIELFPTQFIIGLTIIMVLILSQKEKLHSSVKLIKKEELQSFIRYTVIALVILPLLPNTTFHIGNIAYIKDWFPSLQAVEVINPFQLWLVVALITGIDLLGYILERIFGSKKGWLMASFVGGFISSTATTQSLAQQSKNDKRTILLVIAAITATLASFVEHSLLIFPLNFLLFIKVIPVLFLMAIAGIGIITRFNKSQVNTEAIVTATRKKELFHLYPAIMFALLFVGIKFISSLALHLFGTSGFYFAIALGALPGMDAVLITIAQNAGTVITFQSALIAFIIAFAVNLSVKCLLTFT